MFKILLLVAFIYVTYRFLVPRKRLSQDIFDKTNTEEEFVDYEIIEEDNEL